jgi:hypothetical protein
MKVGDLIRTNMKSCKNDPDCFCFFCAHESNGIGLVFQQLGLGIKHSEGYWEVIFDVGTWRLYGNEAEVINESR